MSVFEGGVGWVNGGMLVRSSERVDLRLRAEEVEPVEERDSAGVACCDSSWESILVPRGNSGVLSKQSVDVGMILKYSGSR